MAFLNTYVDLIKRLPSPPEGARAMADPPILKEVVLSKRRRSEVAQLQVVQIDSYQKQRRTIQLIPKSLNQETYIDLLENPQRLIVFAAGPAGTGKTMLAVLAALKAFRAGECSKIVITRPAVGVDDEQHGFLPGTLNQKMEPWTRPIFDIIEEYYKPQEVVRLLEEKYIEIAPLAYMRGRTFKNSWIIADEMQNATPSQMKMLLTRLGENSKMVVTGDTQQADRKAKDNGLLDFQRLIKDFDSQYIAGVEFAVRDVRRHPAVSEVLKLYGED
jgi:phosphate starvation-inducible PhoH-like protein